MTYQYRSASSSSSYTSGPDIAALQEKLANRKLKELQKSDRSQSEKDDNSDEGEQENDNESSREFEKRAYQSQNYERQHNSVSILKLFKYDLWAV